MRSRVACFTCPCPGCQMWWQSLQAGLRNTCHARTAIADFWRALVSEGGKWWQVQKRSIEHWAKKNKNAPCVKGVGDDLSNWPQKIGLRWSTYFLKPIFESVHLQRDEEVSYYIIICYYSVSCSEFVLFKIKNRQFLGAFFSFDVLMCVAKSWLCVVPTKSTEQWQKSSMPLPGLGLQHKHLGCKLTLTLMLLHGLWLLAGTSTYIHIYSTYSLPQPWGQGVWICRSTSLRSFVVRLLLPVLIPSLRSCCAEVCFPRETVKESGAWNKQTPSLELRDGVKLFQPS